MRLVTYPLKNSYPIQPGDEVFFFDETGTMYKAYARETVLSKKDLRMAVMTGDIEPTHRRVTWDQKSFWRPLTYD